LEFLVTQGLGYVSKSANIHDFLEVVTKHTSINKVLSDLPLGLKLLGCLVVPLRLT
jgi:hypothetical protein